MSLAQMGSSKFGMKLTIFNRTLLGYFKETAREKHPLRQREAEKNGV